MEKPNKAGAKIVKKIVHIVFIGAGMIATGLGACCVAKGRNVVFRNPERSIPRGQAEMERILDFFHAHGLIDDQARADASGLYRMTASLEDALEQADLVIEAAPEELALKHELYGQIEALTAPDTIITSTSSRFTAAELSQQMARPERFMLTHPWHPSYLMPLVEIMGSEKTAPDAVEAVRIFFEQMGKQPVVCRRDMSGCLGNEISWTISNIAKRYVKEGICSAEDIDRVIMYGVGLRLAVTGQLLTINLGTPGGLRNYAAKYRREPEPGIELVAESVDREMAARAPEEGQDWAGCAAYRDEMLVKFLRAEGKL